MVKVILSIVGILVAAFIVFAFINSNTPEFKAQEAVRRLLKDPDSAKFYSVRQREGTSFVCGSVNAKNGFGAYGGPVMFSYDSSTDLAALLSSPREAYIWASLARGCYPSMTIPNNAVEAERMERQGSWNR
jgi:hypothetical protein